MSIVKIKCLRPFRVRSDVFARDSIAKLSFDDAVLVLESGRGELVEPGDMVRLSAHVRDQNARLAKDAERRNAGLRRDPDGPWRPL